MATQAQLLSLVRSFSEGDESRFQAVALQLAADAAGRGQRKLADEIRLLIQDARQRAAEGGAAEITSGPVPLVRPRGELAGVLSAAYPLYRLDDMVLDPQTLHRLRRIVGEHRNRARLAAHKLKPRRKFLLVGPPGTGKTMTAAALAGELSMPLFTIQLDGLITKYMGETSAKLRLVFDAMTTTRGLYFFDEFDALASKRLMANDVGEARRVLNSILQMLEEDKSEALILAATNHAELLDPAIFRRFESRLDYALLTRAQVRAVFEKALAAFDLDQVDWALVEGAATGLSQAEMVRTAEDAARTAVLEHDAVITTDILVSAAQERRGATAPT